MSHKDKIVEVLKEAARHAASPEGTAGAILAKLREGAESIWQYRAERPLSKEMSGWIDAGSAEEIDEVREYIRKGYRYELRQVHAFPPDAQREIERLNAELEREHIRLAACGVVAMADTPESATEARQMNEEYRSASCNDVARRVDECINLRQQLTEAREAAARAEATLAQIVGEMNAGHINTAVNLAMGQYDNSALTAAIAAAVEPYKLDAERYRWLRNRNPTVDFCLHCGYDALPLCVGESLDVAIDASIASAKGDEG